MASLLLVKPGLDWVVTGGLFDFTLEFLISRLSDEKVVETLRTVVDNNLGSLWLTDFPAAAQENIFALLRNDLVVEAERVLPDSPAKAAALDQLRELVSLTYRDGY